MSWKWCIKTRQKKSQAPFPPRNLEKQNSGNKFRLKMISYEIPYCIYWIVTPISSPVPQVNSMKRINRLSTILAPGRQSPSNAVISLQQKYLHAFRHGCIFDQTSRTRKMAGNNSLVQSGFWDQLLKFGLLFSVPASATLFGFRVWLTKMAGNDVSVHGDLWMMLRRDRQQKGAWNCSFRDRWSPIVEDGKIFAHSMDPR